MNVPIDIIAVLLGFFLSNIVWQWWRDQGNKKTLLWALRTELWHIIELLGESSWVPLPFDVWNEVLKSGALSGLKKELLTDLILIYSKLRSKNNLVEYRQTLLGVSRAGIITREIIVVEDGKERPIEDVVGEINIELDEMIREVILSIDKIL